MVVHYTVPDYVIIGAQRAGTTSLYRYLTAHPGVLPAARKELQFFSNRYELGTAWYRAQFPSVAQGTVTGEATPYYLFHPHAPRRLAEVVPTARLIALLRDPVDRAYSHYHHEVRRGFETLSFEEAVAAEEGRLRGEKERMLGDEGYQSFAHQHHSYVARGRYAEQLHVWLRHFPRERVLILDSGDFYESPAETVSAVTEFLGLPPATLHNSLPYNDERYPPMGQAVRVRLTERFTDANRDLAGLVGRAFTWTSHRENGPATGS